jgi:hypothetical protein
MTNRIPLKSKIQTSHTYLLERLKADWEQPSQCKYKKSVGKGWMKIQEVCLYKNREKQRMPGHEA